MPGKSVTKFRWLRTGEDAFPPMLEAIEAATKSVLLEMYIYEKSPIGEQFRAALVAARLRGVEVKVLNDAVGSLTLMSSFWEPLTNAGGQFRWFNPIRPGRIAYRDHRKILVVDDRVGFIGGFNIAPEYAGNGVDHGWRDLGLEIRGHLVQDLADAFELAFTAADGGGKPMKLLQRSRSRKTVSRGNCRLLLSGPGLGYNYMKSTLVSDLANAASVRIICAYFLPTRRIRRALQAVARRGGKVQLVLAGKTDVKLSQLASHRLYQPLMRSGVEIYEYEPQILHAKLFLIDDVVYGGSANLDARSLEINYELLVRISDPQAVEDAEGIFSEVLSRSRRIDLATWRQSRSLWTKLMERWAYFLLARLDLYIARIRQR